MLSEQMQIEAIKAALQGEELQYPPEFFDNAFKRVAALIGAARNKGIDPIDYLGPLLEADAEAEKVIIAATSPRPGVRSPEIKEAGELNYPPTKWLYQDIFVRGHHNALLADGGTGKNWVALHLACCVTNGRKFCGQAPILTTKNVLWIDAEDVFGLNQERLTEWYAAGLFRDEKKIFPYTNPNSGLIDMNQPHIQTDIIHWVNELKPDLIILDSWDMALPNNTFKEDVQGVISFIKKVSKAFDTCWLTLFHPHKRKFAKPTDSIMPDEGAGSRLMKQLTRIFWAMWYYNTGDFSHTDPRVMSLVKSNYKRPETSKWVVDFQSLHPSGLKLDFQPYAMLEADEFDPLDAAAEWVEGLLHAAGSEGIKYSDIKKQAVDSPHGVKVVVDAVKLLQETNTCLNTIGARARGNRLVHANHASTRADARTRDGFSS